MKGHTHLLFAILFGLLYFDHFVAEVSIWLKIGFSAMLVIGALMPDIDQKESSASHKAPWLSGIIRFFSKHRGIMHSIWIPLILLLIAKFVVVRFLNLPDLILMGFLIGYGSHLLSDMLTVQGITPFSPLKFKINGFVKTGGIAEAVIGILIVSFLIVR